MAGNAISVACSVRVSSDFDLFSETGRGSVTFATAVGGVSGRGQVIDYFGGQRSQNKRCGCGAVLFGDCPVCELGGVGAAVADHLFTVASGAGEAVQFPEGEFELLARADDIQAVTP
ncbi:hypothetical protein [Pacificibacter marinus]|uniref:hypothetical protein n=1 Tax=Pacificibacter marinus TaxID=658057 RepID=UPI001C07DED1|nr:hypothetical protein [Pacificibacter marinus]MBU2868968.1 hypothetical protein [Pacificibacter marinus]